MSYDLNKWVANEHRSTRRRRYLPHLLVLLMAIIAGVALMEVFDGGVESDSVANFGPALLLLIVAMVTSPFGRDGWLGLGKARYDEFERLVLARPTARAFAVLLALILLVFTWLWLASLNGWPMPRTPVDWSALGLAFLAIGSGLPVLVAEIMVPLPPEE